MKYSPRTAKACLSLVLVVCSLAIGAEVVLGQTHTGKALVVVGPEILKADDGLPLTQGWRFKAGDSPTWADPALDDTDWGLINNSSLVRNDGTASRTEKVAPFNTFSERTSKFIFSQDWDGLAWFRLRFDVDPSLAGKSFLLDVKQSGASEIFFDGAQVARFGTVGVQPGQEQSFDAEGTPIALTFNRGGEHVLAVRYSCRAAPLIDRGFIDLPEVGPRGVGFVIRIRPMGEAPYARSGRGALSWLILLCFAGILAGFALVHLCVSWSLDDAKLHRLFSLFAFLGSALMLVRFAILAGHLGVGSHAYLTLVFYLLIVLCGVSFTALMHEALVPADPHLHLIFGLVSIGITAAAAVFPELASAYAIGAFVALLGTYARMAIILMRAKARRASGWRIFAFALAGWVSVPAVMVVDSIGILPPGLGDALLFATLVFVGLMASLYLMRKLVHDLIDGEDKLFDLQERYKKMFARSEEASGNARRKSAVSDV